MGAGLDKLLVPLGGREVVAWSLLALDACEGLDSITVVASEHNLEQVAAVLDRLPTRLPLQLAIGGARRQDSVRTAVEALAADPPDLVLVHDGARPLVSAESIRACLEAAAADGAATCGIPLRDSVKEVDAAGNVRRSLERASLAAIQTPQAFRFDLLLRGHRAAVEQRVVVDDDAELVERLGCPVRVVPGDPRNLKLTTRDDIVLAEALLAGAKT